MRTFVTAVTLFLSTQVAFGQKQTIEAQLRQKPVDSLARSARILGNPADGARIFFRAGIACTQCHTAGDGAKLLGPDLSAMADRSNALHIVESILNPNKVVRDGYKTATVILDTGKSVTGIVRSESDDAIELAVPGEDKVRTIARSTIDDQVPGSSLMPTGLVNQFSDVQEFYDLVSFLTRLGAAGPAGAKSVIPPSAMVPPPPLPAYENDLNHRGLINDWKNKKSLQRGKKLYGSLCVNCHGDRNTPGSLPNALRFADGKFKNGHDPYAMYRTITHGYRMMLPQRQLVPQQKYDVINYIREEFLRRHNREQYAKVDDDYFDKLPKGKQSGPAPEEHEPWRDMDYGPFLISTYEMVGPETGPRLFVPKEEQQKAREENRPPNEQWAANTNFAYKGIAVRLDPGSGGGAHGTHWLAFDHDTMRVSGAWSGDGFIDWHGILFDGRHAITPRTVGEQHFATPPGPGWAHPETGSFDDPRLRGRDGRPYGPLPREWAHYKGLYKHGDRVVVSYTVGDAPVLEMHRAVLPEPNAPITSDSDAVWLRALNIGKSAHDLAVRIAAKGKAHASVNTSGADITLRERNGFVVATIPAKVTPVNVEFAVSRSEARAKAWGTDASYSIPNLESLTHGGPAQWSEELPVVPEPGGSNTAFAVDVLTRPTANPWKSRLRMSGLDFVGDGSKMVACCCDGDVWMIDGINALSDRITWKRIASGLFHPLGIKVVRGRIFVTCRDQIVVLNDLNGDGETDFYESFNNDHQVTDHFHEFAMGLQADSDGNLYYAKSARHARDSLVPHHGTLLKVRYDGSRTDILANGFRAANGVCLNPDGSFFVTDQEGHWTPMNRINRVVEGGFYGNMYSYDAPDDSSNDAMSLPLCWPNKPFDRSPSELLWVDSDQWGPLNGSLLNLSYGYGKVFIVPHEKIDDTWQGGMCRLPLPQFPTGVMRARFHPTNGQMYACGMHAWGSNQSEAKGGLYRIRYTGKPAHLPVRLTATKRGMKITFSEPVEVASAKNVDNYIVESWSLRRSSNYGSKRYDEKTLTVTDVEVSDDRRTVSLAFSDMAPTWCMQIAFGLRDEHGEDFNGVIQNTVYKTQDDE